MIKAEFDRLSTVDKYDAMLKVMQRKENLDNLVAIPPSIVTATITGSDKTCVVLPPGVLKTIYFHVPTFETAAKSKKVDLMVTFSELGKTSFGGKSYELKEGETFVTLNLDLASGALFELSKTPKECLVYLCVSFYCTDPRGWMTNVVQRKMFLEE